jgi:translocation and assembly module TamA
MSGTATAGRRPARLSAMSLAVGLACGALCGCGAMLQRLPQIPAAADAGTAPLASAAAPAGAPATATAAAPELTTTPATHTAPGPATANPAALAYRLDIEAPLPLAALLRTYLDLARFQQATAADAITGAELDRLVMASEAQARDLLRTAGFFAAEARSIREVPAADDPTPPLVRVRVTPGPPARVARWTLRSQGELEVLLEQQDAASLATWRAIQSAWPLTDGELFTQDAWDTAKNAVLARLRTQGYPNAAFSGTRADVDATRHEVRLFALVDSGPLVRLGPVSFVGLERYDESAARNMVDFVEGDFFTEKRLLDLQERLGKVGLFDGVTVELDSDPAKAAAAPVLVTLREAPLQQATLGAGVSANTGPRITLEHTHRRPFGLDVIARNKVRFGRDERGWEGSLISHPLRRQYRALASGKVDWLDAGDAITQSRQARIGGSLDTERIERLFFAELLNDEVRNAAGIVSASAVSGNYHLVWRDVDSVLLPTRGDTANMQVGLGHAYSDDAEDGVFARAYGRFTAYRPVGRTWYFTGRLEIGHVQAADAVRIPETLEFRAGGDESVRGYAYRSLGPAANGVVGSGRMVLTTSVEMARPVSAALPSVWGAVFLDAGNAADRWSDWKPVYGLGVGARWRSPVGPLRVDLAYGEAVRRARLHVSVGIAF